MKTDTIPITKDSLKALLEISKKYTAQNQSFDWVNFWAIITFIIVSGVIGGCVNYYYNLKKDSEGNDGNTLFRSVIVGIGASIIVPIFLEITQSRILDGLQNHKLNDCILFISFCVLAAITSTRFISTVSDSVLNRVSKAEDTAKEAKQKADTLVKATEQRGGTQKITETTKQIIEASGIENKPDDLDDPCKGKFGRSREDENYKISVDKIADPSIKGWYNLTYKVFAKDPSKVKLEGQVRFHLHPTFKPDVETVDVVNGVAKLKRVAWGAFTIGIEILSTGTKLELDLEDEPDLPDDFKKR
ncbi:YEATS-associated helix-containing protein [Arcicella sp. LKC2W]|uniref:YEATS-associated helix-containing protein n=1 Tax=Arcicella sp. LKC2W TaxID=2984198 RepID=UPI002B1F0677|nr:YEATS-associated helix-containing protein [Arcicella sp. LKC2W]MEA5460652.1 YEATS-associated helix-containing protein [Arcicella sp. LKC2W]